MGKEVLTEAELKVLDGLTMEFDKCMEIINQTLAEKNEKFPEDLKFKPTIRQKYIIVDMMRLYSQAVIGGLLKLHKIPDLNLYPSIEKPSEKPIKILAHGTYGVFENLENFALTGEEFKEEIEDENAPWNLRK